MKRWHKILISLVVVALIITGIPWWIPFHELNEGQLAIIGESNSGRGIFLLNPLFRTWRPLPTNNLYPWYIAWSPDGQKIAFTYSTVNDDDPESAVGLAILDLENMETEKVYVKPSNERLNLVTWSPDGQILIFDVYEGNALTPTAFRRLDLITGKLQSIPYPKSIQPPYVPFNQIDIDQNNDYVIGGWDGTYIAPPDLQNLRLVGEFGNDFFLTPDGKDIIISCYQSVYCYYNVDTNKVTEIFPGGYASHDFGVVRVSGAGNWPSDERDLVYLARGGEGDPSYIRLLDTQFNLDYPIYKFPHHYIHANFLGESWFDTLGILQLAWYSKK
ncbi:MAG TPA: hypothetical protein VLX61_01015 [Anaerolineales bacterium]|nr:hypothetical protein [Anaerolineales bacterium]